MNQDTTPKDERGEQIFKKLVRLLSSRKNWFYTPIIVAIFYSLTHFLGGCLEVPSWEICEDDAKEIIQVDGAPAMLAGISGMVLAVLAILTTSKSEGSEVLLDLMMERLKFYLLVSLSFSVIAVLLFLNLIDLSPDQTVRIAYTTILLSIIVIFLLGKLVFNITKSINDEYDFKFLTEEIIHDLEVSGNSQNNKKSNDFYKSFSPKFSAFIFLIIKYLTVQGYLSDFFRESFMEIRDKMLKTKDFTFNNYMMELIDRIVDAFNYPQLKNNGTVAFLDDNFIEVLKKNANGSGIDYLNDENLQVMLTIRFYFFVELIKRNKNIKPEIMNDALSIYDNNLIFEMEYNKKKFSDNFGYFYSLNAFLIQGWEYLTVSDINRAVSYFGKLDTEQSIFFFSILLQAYHKKFAVFHSKDEGNASVDLLSLFKNQSYYRLIRVMELPNIEDKLEFFKSRMFQWQFLGLERGPVYMSRSEFNCPFSAMLFWGLISANNANNNYFSRLNYGYCLQLMEDFLSAQTLVSNNSSKFQELLNIDKNDLIQKSNNLLVSLDQVIQQKKALLPPAAEGAV